MSTSRTSGRGVTDEQDCDEQAQEEQASHLNPEK